MPQISCRFEATSRRSVASSVPPPASSVPVSVVLAADAEAAALPVVLPLEEAFAVADVRSVEEAQAAPVVDCDSAQDDWPPDG